MQKAFQNKNKSTLKTILRYIFRDKNNGQLVGKTKSTRDTLLITRNRQLKQAKAAGQKGKYNASNME